MTKEVRTYVNAYTGDESVSMFITFAIEQYKNAKGITGEEAAAILTNSGVLSHLEEYYDVLHTQSAQWLIHEIERMIINNKSSQ